MIFEYFFIVFSTLWKIYYIQFGHFSFFIIDLHLKESQSHTSNIGNIKTSMSYFALKGVLELVRLGNSSCSVYEDLMEQKKVNCQKARNFGL